MQWFNVIVAILALIEANFHMLSSILPATVGAYVFFGVAIANIVLRQFFTKEALSLK